MNYKIKTEKTVAFWVILPPFSFPPSASYWKREREKDRKRESDYTTHLELENNNTYITQSSRLNIFMSEKFSAKWVSEDSTKEASYVYCFCLFSTTCTWRRKQTEQAPYWKQHSILGRTVDWAICPVSMEMTYQMENQAPWVEEPQGSYLDSVA